MLTVTKKGPCKVSNISSVQQKARSALDDQATAEKLGAYRCACCASRAKCGCDKAGMLAYCCGMAGSLA